MFETIVIVVAILAFIGYRQAVDQKRNDEYYQQQAEAERQRAREHDIRMGR